MNEESDKLTDQATPEPDAPTAVEDQAASSEAAESDVVESEELETSADESSSEVVDSDEATADEDADEVDAIEEEEAELEEEEEETAEAEPEAAEEDTPKMDWYILKVQSNRERSIADALRRKIAIEGLGDLFGDVIVPVEKVTEFKGGKKKVVQRKLYPGYIVVNMVINDDTWFAVRETSGIGDFTGAHGKPSPMLPHEVARIVQTEEEETDDALKLNNSF